jgi:hypothetical protein
LPLRSTLHEVRCWLKNDGDEPQLKQFSSIISDPEPRSSLELLGPVGAVVQQEYAAMFVRLFAPAAA